jgi:hypothetical protein
MITHAALSLVLVWLRLPHHSDQGLPATASGAGQPCAIAAVDDRQRETLFQRLRQVRNEIRSSKGGRRQPTLVRTVVGR